MKYLVLSKRADKDEFTERVGAGPDGEDLEFPFQINVQELRDRDVADFRHDHPMTQDLIASIPFTLIEPVEEDPGSASSSQTAWGLSAVGATKCPQNGKGVTVAVLDTGIDRLHPAFDGLKLSGAALMDFTINESGVPGSATDVHGHGTHVAATIFGRNVNSTRIGVAPGVERVLIGKVLSPKGAPTEAIYNAIQWALKERADVISMSLGMNFSAIIKYFREKEGFPEPIAASRALEAYCANVRLFDRLAALVEARVERGHGALLVAASGNESKRREDPRFTVAVASPAAADGFISVGALARTDETGLTVASFSNTGCRISAPGVSILSAGLGGALVNKSGTSMATPHVAGVMALWTQKLFPRGDRPKGWAKEVLLQVEHGVSPVSGHARNDVGRGMIQAPR